MLTEKELLTLERKPSLYRLADGGGLCTELPPTGSPRWHYRYRFQGKAKMLSLSTYSEVKSAQARKLAAAAKDLLSQGVDPSAKRQTDKATQHLSAATAFKAVGDEWLGGRGELAPITRRKMKWMLKELANPWIGERQIFDITAPELLAVLRRVESRGHLETTQRLKSIWSSVMRWPPAAPSVILPPICAGH
ncbi:hypothetical protein HDE76_003767 [Rhodanobacter sp. ANJX3]|uniref:tyrosine-type recombinase/integrase n=1 Tax=Rhodanobacter sp. ANJX3 TaxID=2723083 RepID=UPI00160E5CAC|nr:integrase arm-type DNA-binding domain-containing protein [Rhodanobacter sp. ANJX3]MBB5360523.1 hypothetical protein [Rhodanobacter sp. ANJX3]